MSKIYKGIYRGADRIVKVIKNGELIWQELGTKILSFKTDRLLSPYSNTIYAPSHVFDDLSIKTIVSVKIGGFKEFDNQSISRWYGNTLVLKNSLDNLLGATDWLDIGTEIKIEYM